jgi:bacillithiol system protein YtxJ
LAFFHHALRAAEAVPALPTTPIISEGKHLLSRMLNWNSLTDIAQLNAIKEKSFEKPQVLFKHSTRCGVSSIALRRLEKAAGIANADFHFLDLIRFRKVSDKIAEEFGIYHQSPQILVIKNGDCVYDESHLGINMNELSEQIFSLN